MFEYHGAEHMTIHALEAGDPLTTDAVRKYPTAHPRCGTEFLVVVIVLSIFAFSLVGRQSLGIMVVSRDAADPGDRRRSATRSCGSARGTAANPIVKAIMAPGILVQMITTKRPTDDQIEVAIVSMEQALEADGEAGAGRLGAAGARAARPGPGRRGRVRRRRRASRRSARRPAR